MNICKQDKKNFICLGVKPRTSLESFENRTHDLPGNGKTFLVLSYMETGGELVLRKSQFPLVTIWACILQVK